MPPSLRHFSIDGLRGCAVLGILLMNVVAFAMPFAAYDNPAAFGPMRPGDVAVWAVQMVLVDGKLRAIFSALFGASLLLVAERTAAGGRSPARVTAARLGTLLLFGLAHACLLWDGDILVLYAIVGAVAFLLRRLPIERLIVLAAMLMLLQMAVLGLHYQGLAALARAAALPAARAEDVTLWGQVLDQIGRPSPATLAADLALHRGPWLPLVRHLADQERSGLPYQLLFDGPETLGLMLLGMAGLKSGFLTGAWSPAAYRRTWRLAWAIGLPPLAALAILLVAHGFPPLETSVVTDLAAFPFRWMVAIGHAALIVHWLCDPSAFKARFAAVGRMAFSNYLGTSLLMTALFDGWGLGLYGHVGRVELLAFVAGAWAVMILGSSLWLARFRQGPLEALWRAMIRCLTAPKSPKAIARQSQ